jgi:hypothetical protein
MKTLCHQNGLIKRSRAPSLLTLREMKGLATLQSLGMFHPLVVVVVAVMWIIITVLWMLQLLTQDHMRI